MNPLMVATVALFVVAGGVTGAVVVLMDDGVDFDPVPAPQWAPGQGFQYNTIATLDSHATGDLAEGMDDLQDSTSDITGFTVMGTRDTPRGPAYVIHGTAWPMDQVAIAQSLGEDLFGSGSITDMATLSHIGTADSCFFGCSGEADLYDEPAALFLPFPLKPGQDWSDHYTFADEDVPITVTGRSHVSDYGLLTTPYGTADAVGVTTRYGFDLGDLLQVVRDEVAAEGGEVHRLAVDVDASDRVDYVHAWGAVGRYQVDVRFYVDVDVTLDGERLKGTLEGTFHLDARLETVSTAMQVGIDQITVTGPTPVTAGQAPPVDDLGAVQPTVRLYAPGAWNAADGPVPVTLDVYGGGPVTLDVLADGVVVATDTQEVTGDFQRIRTAIEAPVGLLQLRAHTPEATSSTFPLANGFHGTLEATCGAPSLLGASCGEAVLELATPSDLEVTATSDRPGVAQLVVTLDGREVGRSSLLGTAKVQTTLDAGTVGFEWEATADTATRVSYDIDIGVLPEDAPDEAFRLLSSGLLPLFDVDALLHDVLQA